MIRPQRLQPLKHDRRRDYSHYKSFNYGSLSLPKTGLGRTPLSIKDQGESQFCTAFTVAEAIENQTGIIMSPEYQTAKEGQIKGSPIFSGTDPLTALKSGRSYGALPQRKSPLTFHENGFQLPAQWQQYPTALDINAFEYRRPSFYSVTAGNPDDLDTYSAIQLGLWDARDDKAPVMAAGFWYEAWQEIGSDGILPMPKTSPITRHMYTILDWEERGLKILSHQGTNYGNGGIAYMPEPVVNEVFRNLEMNGLGLYIYRSTKAPFIQELQSWLKKYL